MPDGVGLRSAFAQVRCDHRSEMIHPAATGALFLLSQKVAGPSAENQLCGEMQSSAWGRWDESPISGAQQVAICGLCRRTCECDRPCGPGRPAAGLLPGLNNAVRAQERRADGGDNGAGPDGSAAPVAAAFRWPVSLVEREGIGESGRNGRAGNRAPRTDRSVDHRRHWFSQERPTLGLRGTPVLRSAREAGELPLAVSLSLANHHASLPVGWRLYLPKEWAADHERRCKAGVPDEIGFKTKPEIALEQIEAALKAGLSRGVVLMDAGYGCNTDLRTGISALALTYVAGILPHTTVWTPGTGPLPPKKWSGRGQRPKRLRRDDKHKPISAEELALNLPKRSWRRIEWREGTAE